MPLFNELELSLLQQSCYGNPRLAEWLERMLEEGPGDYDWQMPDEYTDDEVPLFINIIGEIQHQGDNYPATYVALPVICRTIIDFPDRFHQHFIYIIYFAWPLIDRKIMSKIGHQVLQKCKSSIIDIIPHLLNQLDFIKDDNQDGFDISRAILSTVASAKGKRYIASMTSYHRPLIDFQNGTISSDVYEIEKRLGITTLSQNLTRSWQQQWGDLGAPRDSESS
jgi:hypothetical protein